MFADVAWDPLARSDLYDAWWAPLPLRRVLLGTQYVVRSRLAPHQCFERLRMLTEERPKRVIGKVTASRFVLRECEMIGTTPATSLTAVGWIKPTAAGTVIELRVALAPGDCLVYLAVMGAGAFGWLVLAKSLFLDDEPFASQPVMNAVFALAFPIAIGFCVLMLWQAVRGKICTPLPHIIDAIDGEAERLPVDATAF